MAAVYEEQWSGETGAEVYAQEEAFAATPDYVLSLTAPTETFLCNLSDNVYGINFFSFKIRSVEEGSETVLFNIGCQPHEVQHLPPVEQQDDSSRFIQYHFGPEFLELSTIGTTLGFTNGEYPLQNFRMIERHYFRDQLLASYDFSMPFVIPNTANTWEMIYTKPELSEEWKEVLRSCPWEARSDSFFFVEDRLVMHNRAEYNYCQQ
eukprot:TRINITY_DN7281_c2_g5_i1.p1 TRINITY_DN7281_c2_g5~~TRINITY_DN7281_c2_g5_i1.p1  ORF type:complete len:229 (+),score=45.56 TRINITY_DN7281_c2_g5_i1:69-689(+)